METPPLHHLLEKEKTSALLADFAQLLPTSSRVCLVDVEGRLVGYHPAAAEEMGTAQWLSVIEQVRQADRPTPFPAGLATPVRVRGKFMGALIVAPPDSLKPSETASLQLMARFLGLLVEDSLNQRALLQESFDRYREVNLLYHAGGTIATSLDLATVCRLLLDQSVQLVQADEGAVMLLDWESGQLTVWASRGLDAVEDIGPGIPLGYELAGQVVRKGKMQIVDQPELGRRQRPLATLLCIPLRTRDGVLGALSLAYTCPGRTFRVNDVKLLNTLAGQAAVAIDKAQMFSKLTALHTELEAANRRLKELDHLKSSFLGVITHELRSPFANLAFSLQLIERYGTDGWLSEQQEQWAQLARLVQEARGMIDSLVSFAALLSKQGDLFLTEVDFASLVYEVAGILAPVASARQVVLRVVTSGGIPMIMGDEMRLAEAIYHLIHNGIKFNHPGGSVIVHYCAQDEGVALQVQDTGTGISPDKLSSLWDPFAQVADPLKRGIVGMGLGLALVKYVVRAHHGRVGVSSEPGVGSTFSFWLPAAKPRSTGPTPTTAGRNRPSPRASAPRSPRPVPIGVPPDPAGSNRAGQSRGP
jgi:signal transduction histidine kinase